MSGSRKYRFLFVSAPFSGVEVLTRNIKRIVDAQKDIEATWIWIEYWPREWWLGGASVSMNWTVKASLVARWRIHELQREGKVFDAAFFNHVTPLTFLARFRRHVPTILSVDATPVLFEPYANWYSRGRFFNFLKPVQQLKRRLTRQTYADAAMLLPWSRTVERSLVRDYDLAPEKIRIIPPGVDPDFWAKDNSRKSAEPKSGAAMKVLFVGGDFLRKGGDVLLNVSKRQEFARCEFHFVTKVKQHAPGQNVHFHYDIDANSEHLMNLYRSADVFVLPSRADFSPTNAICEAMAMELPVITTNVGGLDQVVIDGENGFVVPVDSENAVAEKLRALINSTPLRTRLGLNGRRKVQSEFNIERNAKMVIESLKEVAGDGNR